MDPKEAKRIFTLINSPTSFLQDQKAVDELLKYVKDRELGDCQLETHIDIYSKCAIYLKREESITEAEFHELRELSIPAKSRQELHSSLGGDRSNINRILNEIQSSSLNKIVVSSDLKEFQEYIFSLTNAKF